MRLVKILCLGYLLTQASQGLASIYHPKQEVDDYSSYYADRYPEDYETRTRRIQEEGDNNTTSHENPNVVHFVFTKARLLSQDLLWQSCNNTNPQHCNEGVAAVSAYLRHLTPPGDPTLVLPELEKTSQFVMVHPLGWNVNRLVLRGVMKWNSYTSSPSLLRKKLKDGGKRDLTYLQNEDFAFVLSNVLVPLESSWNAKWHQSVHFDPTTNIALIVISGSAPGIVSLFTDLQTETEAAKGMLEIVRRENRKAGCVQEAPVDPKKEALYASYEKFYADDGSTDTTANNSTCDEQRPICWTPVILYYDNSKSLFDVFLNDMLTAPYPPAVILDAGNYSDIYQEPTPVQTTPNNLTVHNSQSFIWVHSYKATKSKYFQHQITIDKNSNPQSVENLNVIQRSLHDLPAQYKDETYLRHLDSLQQFAKEAQENDRIIGNSTEVPPQWDRCNVGQCEIGSLFTDVLRWQAKADIAFINSGGLRGDGWEAGPVTISDVWTGLPYPDAICNGTISGDSLLRLLDYSISRAYFNNTHNDDADALLQVSGMRIIYSSRIPQGKSRISNVEILGPNGKWKKLKRLEVYSFATIDFICNDLWPYNDFLGVFDNFTIEGEVAGVVGENIVQDAAAEFFQQLPGPYDANSEGRLIDDPNATILIYSKQTASDCKANEFFSEELQLCITCPNAAFVSFSDALVEFRYQKGRETNVSTLISSNTSSGHEADPFHKLSGIIVMANHGATNYKFLLKSLPDWLEIREAGSTSDSEIIREGQTYSLPPLKSIALHLRALVDDSFPVNKVTNIVIVEAISVSTAYSLNGPHECEELDLTFDVSLGVTPAPGVHQLGPVRVIGLSLMAIAWITALFFGTFVFKYRNARIIKVMQPLFLEAKCVGIFIMASAIGPLSLEDGLLTESQSDAMCALMPWLLSTGFVIVFSSAFCKLWRINKLFHVERFHRVKVTEKDVMGPFLVMFSLNSACLIAWTAIDPLQWTRGVVKGEEWKSYGLCASDDIGYVFLGLIIGINFIALLLACYQAYLARNISDEFCESKPLGLAIFSWVQVLLVGFPAIFLVENDNFSARYFLEVGLIFVMSETMLLLIFVPLVRAIRGYNLSGEGHAGSLAVTNQNGRTTEHRTTGHGTTHTFGHPGTFVSGLPLQKRSDPASNQTAVPTFKVPTEEAFPNVSRLSSAASEGGAVDDP